MLSNVKKQDFAHELFLRIEQRLDEAKKGGAAELAAQASLPGEYGMGKTAALKQFTRELLEKLPGGAPIA